MNQKDKVSERRWGPGLLGMAAAIRGRKKGRWRILEESSPSEAGCL